MNWRENLPAKDRLSSWFPADPAFIIMYLFAQHASSLVARNVNLSSRCYHSPGNYRVEGIFFFYHQCQHPPLTPPPPRPLSYIRVDSIPIAKKLERVPFSSQAGVAWTYRLNSWKDEGGGQGPEATHVCLERKAGEEKEGNENFHFQILSDS